METIMENTQVERYAAYKDSGVEWIGEVPEHWQVSRLGVFLNPISENNKAQLPLLSITREKGVIMRDLDNEDENHNYVPDDLSNYKVLRRGQFGMNKMKAWQGSYGISPYDGIVSPAYFIFNLSDNIDSRYFHMAIRSKLYVAFFGSASDGVRIGQWDLSKNRMKNIPFLVPTPSEQTRITTFLDRKTAQIDQAIAQKERLIELLKERKQILIHNAVTRGLNPDVPMKDSGVEWIGVVPEHWEVVRNQAIFEERNESGNETLPILSISIHTAVSTEEVNDEDNIRGKIRIEDKSNYKLVAINDVAFNMMRAWQGAIGAVRTNGMVSPAYVVAKPKVEIDADFFEFQYRTPNFIQQMDRNSKGITDFRKRLYWHEFKRLVTVMPPLDEQKAVSKFIRNLNSKIDTAISCKQAEIEKLKEYKATLINSAVTGKIKVKM